MRKFKTEVDQLLHLLVHSLYSHSEIFLRELISNSSDALDKLKHLTLTEEAYKTVSFSPKIDIFLEEKDPKRLIISDTGIGMDQEELSTSLGTIARSGTKAFLSQITGDQKKDMALIGQFGVGFYASFMVADEVEVISRRVGEKDAHSWKSDGKTGFTVEESTREEHGTSVILHLNETGKEYASRWRLEQIVKRYSDHISFPIYLHYTETEADKEDKGKEEKKTEQLNKASALWKRDKTELKNQDYKEFYKSLSGDYQDPLHWVHTKAEGIMEYTTLFYIPSHAPFDLYHADYQAGVRLYVRRVFITDDAKELLPVYLRFVRGIIDSDDLPLNVSRELLQKNRILASIQSASVKKLLGEFQHLAKDKETYRPFIENYNRPLKEGLRSDYANKETLLELIRYKSTKEEGWVSLAEYKERMPEEQKNIYYIMGDSEERLRHSPLLEAYTKKKIEVLIMDDEIDEIVTPAITAYQDLPLKAVGRSGSEEELAKKDEKREEAIKPLLAKIKGILGEQVKDVISSRRLQESPSCVVVDAEDPTAKMQRMMQAMGGGATGAGVISKPILEINPEHEIVKSMEKLTEKTALEDASWLLLWQAQMAEGVMVQDPSGFSTRLNRILSRAL